MKEFCILGLGNFGATVARKLAEAGQRVSAVDSDKNKVQAMQEFVHLAIFGDATDRKFLENLEVKNYDCCVVSTGEDSHASILIALYLKELEAKKIVVKANSEDHARILMKVGADETIIPEQEMAVKVARNLAQPNVLDYLPLTEEYSIAEVVPPHQFVGKSLMDLQLRSNYKTEVIAIKDTATNKFKFIPNAAYKLKETDVLVVLGKEESIESMRG
jgi:trk system potassium uptake protein